MSQNSPAFDIEDAIRQLALDIHLLDELREMNNKFNIFKVLKIDQYEIRHSQMLAWLLDPQENHGLGDIFLRNFLREILKGDTYKSSDLASNIDENVLLSNLDCVTIETEVATQEKENNRMDIVLTRNNFSDEKFKIIIENKVNASEGVNQLSKYYDYIIKNFPDSQSPHKENSNITSWKHLFLFLSPEGVQPINENDKKIWIPISYKNILDALSYSIKRVNLNTEINILIQHYIYILMEITGSNEIIFEKCRHIYKTHNNSIEFIGGDSFEKYEGFELGKNIKNKYRKELSLILKYKIDIKYIILQYLKNCKNIILPSKCQKSNYTPQGYQEFYTIEMDNILLKNGHKRGYKYFFSCRQDCIDVCFELLGNHYTDYKAEIDSILLCKQHKINHDLMSSIGKPFNKYCRLFSKKVTFDRTENSEHLENMVNSIMDQLLESALEGFQKNLINNLKVQGYLSING